MQHHADVNLIKHPLLTAAQRTKEGMATLGGRVARLCMVSGHLHPMLCASACDTTPGIAWRLVTPTKHYMLQAQAKAT